jgi:hypothetical protein
VADNAVVVVAGWSDTSFLFCSLASGRNKGEDLLIPPVVADCRTGDEVVVEKDSTCSSDSITDSAIRLVVV